MAYTGADISLIRKSMVAENSKKFDTAISIVGIGNGSIESEGLVAIPLSNKYIFMHIVPDHIGFIGHAILGGDFFESELADVSYKKQAIILSDLEVPYIKKQFGIDKFNEIFDQLTKENNEAVKI